MTDLKPRSLRVAAVLAGLCIGLTGCNEGLLTSGTASATTTATPSSTTSAATSAATAAASFGPVFESATAARYRSS